MRKSNYFYIACSQMYGMLHGMYAGGCLDSVTFADAEEIAQAEAYDVITDYDCIVEALHQDLNETFGYDDTPDDPDEEYLEALEDTIMEEVNYSIFEITAEGEAHQDEMEADLESYEDYVKAGWIKRC